MVNWGCTGLRVEQQCTWLQCGLKGVSRWECLTGVVFDVVLRVHDVPYRFVCV